MIGSNLHFQTFTLTFVSKFTWGGGGRESGQEGRSRETSKESTVVIQGRGLGGRDQAGTA